MTKSTITRERLAKIKSWRETYGAGSNVMLPAEEAEELARIALAAMDGEPDCKERKLFCSTDTARMRKVISVSAGSGDAPLYRHAQQPVVSADLLHTAASAIEDLLTTKDRTGAGVWFDLPFRLRSAANAHSAPVVPDDVLAALQKVARIRLDLNDFDGDRRGIADCLGDAEEALIEVVNRRAAMLHAGNSPAQSDCCPAQNVVVPAQSPIDHGYLPECECSGCKATARICTEMAVNSLVIPNEMTSEQAYEIGYYYGDPVDVFARGANWMRQHIIDSTLAAAPQSPGSEPATVSGKWIPVSERMPESNGMYFGWDGKRVLEVYCFFGGFSANQFIHGEITHWMPLPSAPQEVKGE